MFPPFPGPFFCRKSVDTVFLWEIVRLSKNNVEHPIMDIVLDITVKKCKEILTGLGLKTGCLIMYFYSKVSFSLFFYKNRKWSHPDLISEMLPIGPINIQFLKQISNNKIVFYLRVIILFAKNGPNESIQQVLDGVASYHWFTYRT